MPPSGILNLSFGGLCLAVRNRLLVANRLAYRLFDVATPAVVVIASAEYSELS